jgi:dolichol kinase
MPYFTSGAFLASLLYSPPVAKASLILLTFGDVSATMVGQSFGRIRIGRKSLEGSAAFVAAGALAAIFLSPLHHLPLATIAIGALSGALIELVSTRVNDNLTIPVVTGGVMTLLG